MTKLYLQAMVSCLGLTATLANGEPAKNTTLIGAITESIRAVCQSPSQQGRHWTVQAKADGSATIGLKLADVNAKAGAEFTKEEWEGVQQVLKNQQLDENKDYRVCARELTPKFIDKFAPTGARKSASGPGASKANPAPNASTTNQNNGSVSQESSGEKSPNINDVNGNVNIQY